MAGQRQYEPATVFNARIVDMRHLWEPSREYKGQPTQKPNWFSMFIVPKTQALWFNEPALAGVAAACLKFTGIMQMYQYNPNSVVWPVVDGDMPSPEGKSSEFAKGHWLFSGSSSNPINVEMVQTGGQLVKLQNKVGVKSGDYVMTGVSAAIAQNMANRIKLYLNAVVFTAPGDEIVFANSVSGAELMRMAQQQGLQVAGFSGAPGGFGAAPGAFAGQPFAAQSGGAFVPNGGGPGNFAQPQGAPGFSHGTPQGQHPGFAPTTANPAFGGAPAASGTPNGQFGNATFPSNPGGVPNPSFPGPSGFGSPPNPFGQR